MNITCKHRTVPPNHICEVLYSLYLTSEATSSHDVNESHACTEILHLYLIYIENETRQHLLIYMKCEKHNMCSLWQRM